MESAADDTKPRKPSLNSAELFLSKCIPSFIWHFCSGGKWKPRQETEALGVERAHSLVKGPEEWGRCLQHVLEHGLHLEEDI